MFFISDKVYIQSGKKERSQKEAIVILTGVRDSFMNRRHQLGFFSGGEYDVYIPNYIVRSSYERTMDRLDAYMEANRLHEYKKVYFFAYLLGAWVLNDCLRKRPLSNIGAIVYNRSPLQEVAPKIAKAVYPLVSKIWPGTVVSDLAEIPYQGLPKKTCPIGVLIENKASPFIIKNKKHVLSIGGEISWEIAALNQDCDDFYYTWLHHDQVYYRFDVIGNEILGFFKNGKFSDKAVRKPYNWDPFEVYKEN